MKLRVCKEQKLEEAEEAVKEVEQKLQTSESMRVRGRRGEGAEDETRVMLVCRRST